MAMEQDPDARVRFQLLAPRSGSMHLLKRGGFAMGFCGRTLEDRWVQAAALSRIAE